MKKKTSGWVTPQKESSTIKFLKWDEGDILTVEFQSGAKYEYQNVTREKFTELREAESSGSYFHKEFKLKPGEHPYTQV
jgi:hypothetical protein